MAFEYTNRIIRLDLTREDWTIQDLDEASLQQYLGGSGLSARMLYDEVSPDIDPLSPENALVFMNGLLSGTVVPAASKASVSSKSPLTGIWCEAIAGGRWAAQLAGTPYGGLLITGRAEKPVYLWIDDDEIQLRSAESIWGMDAIEASDALRAETDDQAQVTCIGPAGERLIRMASILFGGHDARAAGRGGLGAVMGSKRLKAVVVRGTGRREIHDEAGMWAELEMAIPAIKQGAKNLSDFGTAGGMEATELYGDIAIKNWQWRTWREGARKIAGQETSKTMLKGHYSCHACPIGCGKIYQVREGPYRGLESHAPEYETLAGFGALCLNDDAASIVKLNDLCNRYGLDTISTSSCVAFAMEAYERGILDEQDTDGIRLVWGDADAIVRMVHKIGRQEGIGKVLGEGVKRASEIIGQGSEAFAIHVKGLEHPYHDPRAFTDMAANYATSNRGACHLESFSYPLRYGVPLPDLGYDENSSPHTHDGRARMTVVMQNLMSVYNALGICKFLLRGSVGPNRLSYWLNLATGWDTTPDGLMKTGERIFTLKRAYNVRLGIRRKDDALPQRLLNRKEGGEAGSLPDLSALLEKYYVLRGWTEDGVPSRKRLVELGLEDVADELHGP